MKKKCKVVMLPTNQRAVIYSPREGLLLPTNSVDNSKYTKQYHLYILSDDEIKKGDWVIANYSFNNKSVEQIKSISPNNLFCNIGYELMTNRCKKIIATTDQSLESDRVDYMTKCKPQDCREHNNPNRIDCGECKIRQYLPLPRPSNEFIQKFCEKGGIREVMVEYEEYVIDTYGWDKSMGTRLKVAPDNTIFIFPIEEETFSKQQVIELCRSAYQQGMEDYSNSEGNFHQWHKLQEELL